MEKHWNFIGIDVSKSTLDVYSIQAGKHIKVKNTEQGLTDLITACSKWRMDITQVWFVFEHTGMYSQRLVKFCSTEGIRFSEVSAMAIKRSLGIARGKNDKVDAKRISLYGIEKQSTLVPSPAYQADVARLKTLMHLRDRMVKQRAGYVSAIKEMLACEVYSKDDPIILCQQKLVKEFDIKIKEMKKEVEILLQQNEQLLENYNLITSVKGIGFVTAVFTLIYTSNFTRFTNARKFACYCGTAPFEKSSGTSIRGKTAISNLANKKMKSLLDQAAKTACQHDPELKAYYQQRKQKGKNKMSSINILRNKLITRMFAVVREKRPYQVKIAA